MSQSKNKIVSRIINVLLIGLVAALVFIPSFKAKVLNGLISIGLFKPDIERPAQSTSSSVASNIEFIKSDGSLVHSDSFKGKVVFINFWATWCPPCIAEMPSINNLYLKNKHNPNIIFLMVDADNDLKTASSFMNKKGYALPLATTNSPVPAQWFKETLPTTVVLDKEGNIAYHHEGIANYETEEFQQFLKRLVDK